MDSVESRLRAIEQQIKRQGDMVVWLVDAFLSGRSGSDVPKPPTKGKHQPTSLSRPSEASELDEIRQNIAFINSEGGIL